MQCHICDISAKDVYIEPNCEETSDKSNLRDILQINCSILFKSDKVFKVKEIGTFPDEEE